MTTLPVSDWPLDTFWLDDAALAHRFAALLADPASSPGALCCAIMASCMRRMEGAEREDVLTPAEWVCMDALDLDGQVLNGGFEQWVTNGYLERARQTLHALTAIGAERAARLLRRALDGLPAEVRCALDEGGAVDDLLLFDFGPRRSAYFDRLSNAYFDLPLAETVRVRVAAFARRHGVAPRPLGTAS